MSDPFAALDTLWADIWDRLARGAAQSGDPFRFVTLATTGSDGPEARTVGLRAADRNAGTVEVHSDLRTAKVRALRADSRAQLLFWDAGAQVQIRVSVVMSLMPAAPDRWDRIPGAARLNYGTDPAPGTPVAAPAEVTRTPDIARFIALSGRVTAVDIVSLAHDPHRRAQFGAGGARARWVAP